MSKPTKIAKYRDPEKPGRWWLTDFTMEQVENRIASLEKHLAPMVVCGTHRHPSAPHEKDAGGEVCRSPALAPPAQTQQGLSEGAAWSISGGGHDKRSVEIVTPDGDVVAEVFGSPAHLETAQQRAEAICAARRPSTHEKQPSPAAAPAQLPEALADERRRWREAVRMDREAREGNERGMKTADWEALRAPLEKLMAEAAALAGQPAPTEDREALRAAALESHERFREAALPLAQAAYWYREAYAHDPGHEDIQKAADKLLAVARRSSRLADFFVNEARALAGSPAQRARHIETPATEKPGQGQLGKKVGE